MKSPAELERAYREARDPARLEELRRRYRSGDTGGRLRLLEELNTSYWGIPAVFEDAASRDPDPQVRTWAAANIRFFWPGLEETEGRLSEDPDPLVRAALAGNETGRGFHWNSASELERHAYLRRLDLAGHDEFVVNLFDPDDESLGLTLEERQRYAVTFLSARAGRIAELGKRYRSRDYPPLHYPDLSSTTGAKLIELMPKWSDSAAIPAFVYRFCHPGDSAALVYEHCHVPRWRRALLDNIFEQPGYWLDGHLQAVESALKDPDPECREQAFRNDAGLNAMRPKLLKAVLKGTDKVALRGLAENFKLRGRQLRKVAHALERLGDKYGAQNARITEAEVRLRDPWQHGDVVASTVEGPPVMPTSGDIALYVLLATWWWAVGGGAAAIVTYWAYGLAEAALVAGASVLIGARAALKQARQATSRTLQSFEIGTRRRTSQTGDEGYNDDVLALSSPLNVSRLLTSERPSGDAAAELARAEAERIARYKTALAAWRSAKATESPAGRA